MHCMRHSQQRSEKAQVRTCSATAPPPPLAASAAFSCAISSCTLRSIVSLGSSFTVGLFLMFFARFA